jgi:hypothetical protein
MNENPPMFQTSTTNPTVTITRAPSDRRIDLMIVLKRIDRIVAPLDREDRLRVLHALVLLYGNPSCEP